MTRAVIGAHNAGFFWWLGGARFFIYKFPFHVFALCDFTENQKVPEGVVGVKDGMDVGGVDSVGVVKVFRVQEIFDTEFAADILVVGVFATTMTIVATDTENIATIFVIRIGHYVV